MKRLAKWIRALLYARRWETMRKAAVYQAAAGAWDYMPRERVTHEARTP